MADLRVGISGWTYGPSRDVFVYFDDDAKVHAPFDALRLAERLGVGRERDDAWGGARTRTARAERF